MVYVHLSLRRYLEREAGGVGLDVVKPLAGAVQQLVSVKQEVTPKQARQTQTAKLFAQHLGC